MLRTLVCDTTFTQITRFETYGYSSCMDNTAKDDHTDLRADDPAPSTPHTADEDISNVTPSETRANEDSTASAARQRFEAPPFWNRHDRSVSSVSYQSLVTGNRPPPITLEDHSEEHDVQTQGCWAKSVTIDDYVIISGPTGIGAYVVWNCTVKTLKGGDMSIRKRYSEFDKLRIDLVLAFPHAEASIPQLPRKSVVSRFRNKFLEQRKNGLNHFMNCILLNPEFAASPILKEFVFS